MSRIILAPDGGGAVTTALCLDPVDEYPVPDPSGGTTCIINLKDHVGGTDPDGLYIYSYNDAQWKQMETL